MPLKSNCNQEQETSHFLHIHCHETPSEQFISIFDSTMDGAKKLTERTEHASVPPSDSWAVFCKTATIFLCVQESYCTRKMVVIIPMVRAKIIFLSMLYSM